MNIPHHAILGGRVIIAPPLLERYNLLIYIIFLRLYTDIVRLHIITFGEGGNQKGYIQSYIPLYLLTTTVVIGRNINNIIHKLSQFSSQLIITLVV